VIIEALGIPAIFNSYYTLGFAALIYAPLIIVRAYLEERELIKIFGKDYVRYSTKTIGLSLSGRKAS
jgi:protein-S-isoprenylcysteine O-methyltransferase Ste14